ncbi:hypothetical protein B1F74_12815 [Pseudomonas syringae]|nr:hypothetical protein B1F74_12815 [Pseudomonas syringae]
MFAKGAAARHLSFLTLQRGNACRDAPRHRSAPRHIFRTGRRASRTAYPREVWPDTYRHARVCF